MKNVIIIISSIITLFTTSCRDRSVSQFQKNSESTTDTVKVSTIDSMRIINSLIQTEFDSVISSLKLLPQYKNAVWLTPKQTQNYLASAQRNQIKFLTEKIYSESEGAWEKYDDTTLLQISHTWSCHINFDTTQGIYPIIKINRDHYEEYKDTRSKKQSDFYGSHSYFSFFYLPKIRIGYITQYNTAGGKEDYSKELGLLDDRDIRNNFSESK